jgi:hypothetical protein
VTACYPGGESAPTNEAGAGTSPGAAVTFVSVTTKKVTAKGTGFAGPVQVFIDGIPFATAAKVKGTTKVTQKGNLLTGQSLGAFARQGQSVSVTFRNADGGTTTVTATRQ